jgi:hypothetical protein
MSLKPTTTYAKMLAEVGDLLHRNIKDITAEKIQLFTRAETSSIGQYAMAKGWSDKDDVYDTQLA